MRRLASLATAPSAVGAAEAVRAALVVGADADGQVVRGQLHVAAARAVRPDRRHRSVPVPGSCFRIHGRPAVPASVGTDLPSAGPRGRLRACGRPRSRIRAVRHDVTTAFRATLRADGHHVRPPWGPARGAREHDPGVPAGARGRGDRASRPTCGCSADGEVVCVARPGRARRAPAAPKIADTTAAELAELGDPPARRRLRASSAPRSSARST